VLSTSALDVLIVLSLFRVKKGNHFSNFEGETTTFEGETTTFEGETTTFEGNFSQPPKVVVTTRNEVGGTFSKK